MSKEKKAEIYYRDIGDYLTRGGKLEIIKSSKSIGAEGFPWVHLKPNQHGDWISERNSDFETYIPLAPEKKFDFTTKSFFVTYSLGTASNRDTWVYNFSYIKLKENIKKTIEHYNSQIDLLANLSLKEPNRDSSLGSWSRDWLNQIKKGKKFFEENKEYRVSLYRPFSRLNIYFSDDLNQERYQLPKIFPTKEHENLVICVSSIGANNGMSVLISNCLVDLHFNGDTQCFPLYFYEGKGKRIDDLFDVDTKEEYIRREGVSNFILEQAKNLYGKVVTKEDLFYYVYGMLHSTDYREKYASDLKKMLPRLPLLETVKEFWAFSKTGRKLAELHLNYESLPAPDGVIVKGDNKGFFKVEKMRFPSKGEKETILFNGSISISNIPLQAYDYIVNGKSAIEWIMERYQITTNKDSGIRNDPNDWALEHNKPRYVLDLLLSIINLSHQSVTLISSLPKLTLETE